MSDGGFWMFAAVLLFVAAAIGGTKGNSDDMLPSMLCLVTGWFSFLVGTILL